MTTLKTLLAAVLICGLFIGCTTIDPTTGEPVPDKAKTAEVKAVARGVATFAIREAIAQFPKEADQIALYSGAVGSVFCEMQRTKEFSPLVLEAALAKIVLPQLTNANVLRYVQTARDAIRATYEIAWAKRFNAELNEDEWVMVVSEIFCDAINTALVDSGRPPIKSLKFKSLGGLPAMAPTDKVMSMAELRKSSLAPLRAITEAR